MKTKIEVKDRKEGEAIRRALEDPVIYATVMIAGVLKQLPTERARKRVLTYVMDKLDEEDGGVRLVVDGKDTGVVYKEVKDE